MVPLLNASAGTESVCIRRKIKNAPTKDIGVVIEDSDERRGVRSTRGYCLRRPCFILSVENMDRRWVGFVAIQNIDSVEELCEITCGLGAIKWPYT